MMSQTFAYIVCSPRGRTGTTTTARLLADFFTHHRRPFVGFDTDPHESAFANWFPRDVGVNDVAAIKGQISLFDRLLVNDGTPKIVDLWSRSWKPFFAIVREIGFFEEARRLSVQPVFVFVVDASSTSLDAANLLASQWPDVMLVVVNNEGAAPLGHEGNKILVQYPTSRSFYIPALDPVVARAIEARDMSLSRFLLARPTDMSIVVRAALHTWLARVFAQFHSFELRLAMEETEYLR